MSRGAGGAGTSVGDSGHPGPAESAAGAVMDFQVGTERPSAGPKAKEEGKEAGKSGPIPVPGWP